MNTRLIGQEGEDIACAYLKRLKYKVLARNFVAAGAEIDIIATHKKELVFIEVKRRNTPLFGTPAEAVTPQKQRRIARAAEVYLKMHGKREAPFRYDIVEVTPEGCNVIERAW
ncbi:MAG: YraN family protein [Clostridiales bacterium]|jgi:putative endonuclease|nr:YraN family protein [Clostridiales bacterium]